MPRIKIFILIWKFKGRLERKHSNNFGTLELDLSYTCNVKVRISHQEISLLLVITLIELGVQCLPAIAVENNSMSSATFTSTNPVTYQSDR